VPTPIPHPAPLAFTLANASVWTLQDLQAVPGSHALVAFEHADGSTIQLLTTADAKELASSRLIEHTESTARADLSAITRSLRVWPASCSLEADLLHAQLGRSILGEKWTEIEQSQAFHCLAADATETALPRFRTIASTNLHNYAQSATRIGPFTTRRRAERFADELIDLFDLCREYDRLAIAPNATACVYKELGKCPAACDGSETIDTYRIRFARALATAADDPEDALIDDHARMNEAAKALDFERAESLRVRIEKLTKLRATPDHLARDLSQTRWLVASPTKTGKALFASLICAGRVCAIEDPKPPAIVAMTPTDLDVIASLTKRFAHPDPRDPARLFLLADTEPSTIELHLATIRPADRDADQDTGRPDTA